MQQKYQNRTIEVPVWQLIAIGLGIAVCVVTLIPLVFKYRQQEYQDIDPFVVPSSNSDDVDQKLYQHQEIRKRYARQVTSDQCGFVPPMCPATTAGTASPMTTTMTTRPPVTTVSITRPMITNPTTTPRTTTPDPWFNTTRPYNSWRLPNFAIPLSYTLRLSCPDCFDSNSDMTNIPFMGHLQIRFRLIAETEYLILHAKGLKIQQAQIVNPEPISTSSITELPEFEMIHLNFAPEKLPMGEHTLEIIYQGQVNTQDQTGFYREVFWKSVGVLS